MRKKRSIKLLSMEDVANIKKPKPIIKSQEHKQLVNATLEDYQQDNVKFAMEVEKTRNGGFIWDEMGTGKTLTMLAIYVNSIEKYNTKDKMLVICNINGINEWIKEVKKWTKG